VYIVPSLEAVNTDIVPAYMVKESLEFYEGEEKRSREFSEVILAVEE